MQQEKPQPHYLSLTAPQTGGGGVRAEGCGVRGEGFQRQPVVKVVTLRFTATCECCIAFVQMNLRTTAGTNLHPCGAKKRERGR